MSFIRCNLYIKITQYICLNNQKVFKRKWAALFKKLSIIGNFFYKFSKVRYLDFASASMKVAGKVTC